MASNYSMVAEQLKSRAVGTEDLVSQVQQIAWASVALPALREEQQAAVTAWHKTRCGVVVMPTGSGKTEVALRIIADQAKSTLVVAPIRDLMYQWHRRILRGLGYDAGILGDSSFNVKPITLTTYDSACIPMPSLGNRFGLIVFDECHHLPTPMRSDAARMCIAPQRLGLSATPERSDGAHQRLGDLIGPEVYRLEIPQIRGKSLADYGVFRIPVYLNDQEQQRYNELSAIVRHYFSERRQDAAEPWFEHDEQSAKQKIAAELKMSWPELERKLFSDLLQYHRLKSFDSELTPADLLARYNVAQVQVCLFDAVKMTVMAHADFKHLLRYAKLAGLMHRIERVDGGYRIELDGPASVLQHTHRYGVSMAKFLPGLLACKDWSMKALLRVSRWNRHAVLELDSHSGLSSRAAKANEFDSSVEAKFAERWGAEPA